MPLLPSLTPLLFAADAASADAASAAPPDYVIPPLVILALGIGIVLGMIIVAKINAFIALITAAIVVSLLDCVNDPADLPASIERVAEAFGGAAGKIGIVIALAAVIGQCMMDSGAADRIVRAFMRLLGEKRAPWALMGSGYVLAIPVFFDTVFYLLVPLARSFYRRVGRNYLLCILAIAAGGAITHTLVPPTPGPLFMAEALDIDMGVMIGVGALVALPAAVAGVTFSVFLDRRLDIAMRPIGDEDERPPLEDHELPGLFVSLMPVLLPVVLIACHTVADSLAKQEATAAMAAQEVRQAETELEAHEAGETATPEAGAVDVKEARQATDVSADADKPAPPAPAGRWTQVARITAVVGHPSLALLLSTAVALLLLLQTRRPSLDELARLSELALMSAGVIILITAAGAAFGAMLQVADIGPEIQRLFGGGGQSDGSPGAGLVLLVLGFGIAALLKVAQGSSTAAMIVGSGMMGAFLKDFGPLPFHVVYVATAIGAGSLVGSWMNDSGFWIFAKMGGLTETEALKSWTPLLVVLGVTSFVVTIILSQVLPLTNL